jgi:butyrate kinase
MLKILVINPGSTSTRIAVYEDEKVLLLKTLMHLSQELDQFETIALQFEFRREVILKELMTANIDINEFNAVIGRGGLVRPIESGVYEVNEALRADLVKGIMGQHASNLGGLIALDIAKGIDGCRAFIADPAVVDELEEVARITGHPLLPNESKFHALNHKAVARKFAASIKQPYEELNLIVAHLGGGISVGAHRKGRVIDVNNALDGFGPFAPDRAGTVPAGRLIDLCFSGKYTIDEMKDMITGKGGLVAHLGTNQAHIVAEWASEGNEKARLILHAMAYNIAKAIGAQWVVLKGVVDGIILTGGMAQNEMVVGFIREYIDCFGKITIYPGEDEMQALSLNALEVLKGERICKIY